MPGSQMDVLVDVAPGITVYKQNGKWFWKGRPGITLEDVLKELAFQAHRLNLRSAIISEALEELKATPL